MGFDDAFSEMEAHEKWRVTSQVVAVPSFGHVRSKQSELLSVTAVLPGRLLQL